MPHLLLKFRAAHLDHEQFEYQKSRNTPSPHPNTATLSLLCIKSGLWAGTRHTIYRSLYSIMTISNNGPAQVAEISTTSMNGAAKSIEGQIPKKLHGRAFYESIGSPKFVLAPMVDQSEFVCRMPFLIVVQRILIMTIGLAHAHSLLHDSRIE